MTISDRSREIINRVASHKVDTIISESSESKAISISWMNSSDKPKDAVEVYGGMSDVTFRFYGLPREMKYEYSQDPYDAYSDMREELEKLVRENNGSIDEYKEYLSQLSEVKYAGLSSNSSHDAVKDPLAQKFENEISQITDHLVTLFKAKVVEYSEDRINARNEALNAIMEKAKKELTAKSGNK